MDPLHVPILHGSFSGDQFNRQMSLMPGVAFSETPRGILCRSTRTLEDGRVYLRISEAVLPTLRVVANPRAEGTALCSILGWVLPIDDTSFRIYSSARVTERGQLTRIRSRIRGKLWEQLTPEEHRDFPGDYEAQVSQGPIALHSAEHLVSSDKGVGMLRQLLRRQLTAVAAGKNPIGTAFEESAAYVTLEGGTAILEHGTV